jgi:hypothetical protein
MVTHRVTRRRPSMGLRQAPIRATTQQPKDRTSSRVFALLKGIVPVLGVASAIFYGLLWLAYYQFYSYFGITSEEVGIGRVELLSRALIGPSVLVLTFPLLVIQLLLGALGILLIDMLIYVLLFLPVKTTIKPRSKPGVIGWIEYYWSNTKMKVQKRIHTTAHACRKHGIPYMRRFFLACLAAGLIYFSVSLYLGGWCPLLGYRSSAG